ncbi:MAG: cytidylate kinase-like family protein [Gemmatimonadota bacterium]|nr:cytidylate kinase-like family protein [Gemmatimonadota bacterium]MDH3367389.1 cytidylate kinase-like family protein [Gemmatimonadota bacterium]MDH3478365.1 cytidylate kinase-like family protein [Gemmatimonadota bacterium]MDH3570795.1 cytidylate kinase-like family protein [Gemmatimonadota bacterium]MDH5549704.1 cytidylate kinase-like family protein [Gemmatimonadota bacterium]
MPVITISRQYASGGSDIARRIAERLGWPLIDNEFVDRVARETGVPPLEVEEREERVPSLVERLARALAVSSPEVFVTAAEPPAGRLADEAELVRATEIVIQQAVREAPYLIMVGRGAQACLAQRDDALHVFIVAPREARVQAAVRRLNLGRDKAEETVNRTDAGRRRYVETYYDRDWDNADNYHLVINTGVFNYDDAAGLVIEAARLRGWVGG